MEEVVVVEIGSHRIKSGIAGDDVPKYSFDWRKISDKDPPIVDGKICCWDSVEDVFQYVYEELKLRTDNCGLIVVLGMGERSNKAAHRKMIRVAFEKMVVPGLIVAFCPLFALYASGRSTGVVVDIGHDQVTVVAVYETAIMDFTLQTSPVAGKVITDYVRKLLLKNRGVSVSFEEAEKIKEHLCGSGPRKQEDTYLLNDGTTTVCWDDISSIKDALFEPEIVGDAGWKPYIPWKTQRLIWIARKDPEHLFRKLPRDVIFLIFARVTIRRAGLNDMIFACIRSCEREIVHDLYANIVLTGGSSFIRGVQDQVHSFASECCMRKVLVIASPERKIGAWIGGSIVGSLSTMQHMYFTRDDYDDLGTDLVYRNDFY